MTAAGAMRRGRWLKQRPRGALWLFIEGASIFHQRFFFLHRTFLETEAAVLLKTY
jgi:hypothetical protein